MRDREGESHEEVGYLYDPGRNQQDVTNMLAAMKGAGVTTVVLACDPISMIFLTQSATARRPRRSEFYADANRLERM